MRWRPPKPDLIPDLPAYRSRPADGFAPERIVLARGCDKTVAGQRLAEAICAAYPRVEIIEALDTPHNRIALGPSNELELHYEGKRTLVLAVAAVGLSTRRVRGMFYTPAPIVDYMAWATLSRLLADRTLDELAGLHVLDLSCGCGAFLIGCFRFLIRWYEQCLGDHGMAWQHALDLMGRAFRGCDIDTRALQWTAKLLSLAAWRGVRKRRRVLEECAD
jgi:hypothetical protein